MLFSATILTKPLCVSPLHCYTRFLVHTCPEQGWLATVTFYGYPTISYNQILPKSDFLCCKGCCYLLQQLWIYPWYSSVNVCSFIYGLLLWGKPFSFGVCVSFMIFLRFCRQLPMLLLFLEQTQFFFWKPWNSWLNDLYIISYFFQFICQIGPFTNKLWRHLYKDFPLPPAPPTVSALGYLFFCDVFGLLGLFCRLWNWFCKFWFNFD